MEEQIELRNLEEEQVLLGPQDRLRRLLTGRYAVEVVSRGGALKILGEEGPVKAVRALLEEALAALRNGSGAEAVERILGAVEGAEERQKRQRRDAGPALAQGIQPRSPGQTRYVASLASSPITIVIGPAGTGKTFLAVAKALASLRAGEFRKMVLARPAVEAGERLGFLPGDLQAKVNPYLRPLYDALFALLDGEQVRRYLETDVIEVVPLAYMRGRTLDRAFIILDEAQNATPGQMKMFLTRMGAGSKIVVTGDVTQTDLPPGALSGLVHCSRILAGIDGISIVHLTRKDIVRHPLVQRIVVAYEREERRLGRGRRKGETPRGGDES
ncbi:MAG: PhoH family protein [Planctomycetes bacterium]|nr:PhoH family protein [Planctomycetota bacterium]